MNFGIFMTLHSMLEMEGTSLKKLKWMQMKETQPESDEVDVPISLDIRDSDSLNHVGTSSSLA